MSEYGICFVNGMNLGALLTTLIWFVSSRKDRDLTDALEQAEWALEEIANLGMNSQLHAKDESECAICKAIDAIRKRREG